MDPNFGAQVVLEKVFRGHQKSKPLVIGTAPHTLLEIKKKDV